MSNPRFLARAPFGYGNVGGGNFRPPFGVKPVSSHTSEPSEKGKRVFVGNLNTKFVTREQLDKLYGRFGTIKAVSLHAGYAFIQFAAEAEARNAVSFTDGITFGGQTLDVNIASEPKSHQNKVKSDSSSNNGSDFSGPKRRRAAGLFSVDIMQDPTVTSYPTNPYGQYGAGMYGGGYDYASYAGYGGVEAQSFIDPSMFYVYEGHSDKFICGHCKLEFDDYASFGAHRTQPCILYTKPIGLMGKQDGEPMTMKCFICKQAFQNSWRLIQHISEKHSMNVVDQEQVLPHAPSKPEPLIKPDFGIGGGGAF